MTRAATTDEERYREAERRLWDSVGAEPTERRVRLPRSGADLRLQEVGEGPPVLFVHGGPNSGSTWAALAALLPDFRCLLLDRPGTGLSAPLARPAEIGDVIRFGETFVGDLLDELGLPAISAVASSFGGYLLLHAGAAEPDRLDRVVQMGCPALVPGMRSPGFMRVMGTPVLGRVVRALPPTDRASRMILRQIGHGPSLDTGRIPEVFLEWYLALQRHTETMANDGAVIAQAAGPRGFDPDVFLTEQLLGKVKAPTLLHWGTADSFGGEDVARRLAGLLPDATLDLVPDAGHLPWLDDPARAAGAVRGFLRPV
jgi:pimeloyl-ACP methyl ester carboxylesterase